MNTAAGAVLAGIRGLVAFRLPFMYPAVFPLMLPPGFPRAHGPGPVGGDGPPPGFFGS